MLTNILYLIQLRVIHACTALTEIKNMENLYTDACTNMSYMFSSCTSLTTLDLRSFNIKISNYMEENDFDNILVLYNFINLATDSDIIKIKY